MMQLIKQQMKVSRFGVFIWTIFMFFMTFVSAAVFPEIKKQGEQMQEMVNNIDFIKSIVGTLEMTNFDGFMISKNFSMLPFLLAFYVVTVACQMVSREMDSGSIEYTLALPIKRTQYLLSKIIVMVINLLIIHIGIVVATILGRVIIGETGVIKEYIPVALTSWLLTVLLGLLVTFISLFINDYTKSLMIGFGTVMSLYVLEVFIQMSDIAKNIQAINPFYHFKATEIFHGTNDMNLNMIYLLSVSVVCLISSLLVFNKKEINP